MNGRKIQQELPELLQLCRQVVQTANINLYTVLSVISKFYTAKQFVAYMHFCFPTCFSKARVILYWLPKHCQTVHKKAVHIYLWSSGSDNTL